MGNLRPHDAFTPVRSQVNHLTRITVKMPHREFGKGCFGKSQKDSGGRQQVYVWIRRWTNGRGNGHMQGNNSMSSLQRVAFIGNHLPRRCGIATFTHDLHRAVALARPNLETGIVAITNSGSDYTYPPAIRFQIKEEMLGDYAAGAAFLNRAKFDVVSLQHEYGIFGGEAGSYINELLSRLEMPIVTTLHTVLAAPTLVQRQAMTKGHRRVGKACHYVRNGARNAPRRP